VCQQPHDGDSQIVVGGRYGDCGAVIPHIMERPREKARDAMRLPGESIHPIRPSRTDLVGCAFKPAFLPPSIMPSDGHYGPPGRKRCPSVQHGLRISLQDVRIDACVSRPGQGGVPGPPRTRLGCPSSVTSASQPVASRKVAVVITRPAGPSSSRSSKPVLAH
jgi:hypothetical protein